MRRLVVIGGTGFLGRALVMRLCRRHGDRVSLLVHQARPGWLDGLDIEAVVGNAEDPALLNRLIEPGATVLNLMRPGADGLYQARVENLLRHAGRASRFIHCSSIDVFGTSSRTAINEFTPPNPVSAYERAHFAAEQAVLGASAVDGLVLRLGALFGPGGQNILTIAQEAARAPLWRLALRRSLYGRRRMHLLPVDTAAAAVEHLAVSERPPHRLFVLTDDDAPENNFAYVQDRLLESFRRPSLQWVPELPPALLRAALTLRRRSNADPLRRFHTPRLDATGFVRPIDFATALRAYAVELASEGAFRHP